MIWLVLVPVLTSIAFIVLRMIGHNAARSARMTTGEPTPEEARISKTAEDEKSKVANASGQDLADKFFDRMRN